MLEMQKYDLTKINFTTYLFFTGKGGVGKTSLACATAVGLADQGKKVLLISTDPASNLQDVFNQELNIHGKNIEEVPGLTVANLDPELAAAEYKESVVAAYRGKLPATVIQNMEEQLSGSCTVEIAAFNEFCTFLTDDAKQDEFDHIIFDTAPTGHTLRMLQLPSAWNTFINDSTHGASCLGQLSGLQEKKNIYKQAVEILSDIRLTQLILVTRPEESPLKEASRSSQELKLLGLKNQVLVVNGLLDKANITDEISQFMFHRQQLALENLPNNLKNIESYKVSLRSYHLSNINSIRKMLHEEISTKLEDFENISFSKNKLEDLINDLYLTHKRVIFTMGKGGVGKTTLATQIAQGLAKKGLKVHLTTTDPANHLNSDLINSSFLTLSHIDEKKALNEYKKEVLDKARETLSDEDIAYIEEDLRSPCTQEIAVFKAFAQIVEKADDEIVVIDTAPTGHTLLLLDASESYHKEVERSRGDIPNSVKNLLPRLRDSNVTEVVIVTLPEATPVLEAERLQKDLKRANIFNKWWIVNSCLSLTKTNNPFLMSKAQSEIDWIAKVDKLSHGNVALVQWMDH